MARNDFRVGRDLRAYVRNLGAAFEKALQGLGPEQTWLDAGAGKGFAMLQYYKGSIYADRQVEFDPSKARLIALNAKTPEDARGVEELGVLPRDRFQYVEDYVEKINPGKIGQVDLITDVFGPFSYSTDIKTILEKYWAILKENGDLFLYFNNSNTSIDRMSKNGRILKRYRVEELIAKKSKGFKLVSVHAQLNRDGFRVGEAVGLYLKRTADSVQFPSLLLETLVDQPELGIPLRYFKLR